MSKTIKTTLHVFNFDTRNPEEKTAWLALRESLKSGPREMESWGGKPHMLGLSVGAYPVELDTSHVFDNQWNTSADTARIPNFRVFDFAFDAEAGAPNKAIKRGHWIEQTAEMRAIRENTMKCGYCGKQEPAQNGYVFCPHCIDSEHLKETDLKLTRMLPAGVSFGGNRPALSEDEAAHLLPLYRTAQIHGNSERGKARIAKARADIKKEYDKTIHEAKTKFEGFTWLMDRGINTGNCIYYSHTDVFSFGWREPLSDGLVSGLLDQLANFPFRYEMKCANGRTLSNKAA